ncbi:MAG: DinB family protein [Fimbriimonas sp.]
MAERKLSVEMETLIEGLDYDRWANGEWFRSLEAKGWPEPDRSIFGHILAAQETMLMRIRGTAFSEAPKPEIDLETMDRLYASWKELLGNTEGDPEVVIRRPNGEVLPLRVSHMARHAMNHGTYHRGELRGLCRARGDEDFPETDLARFFAARAAS